VSSEVQIADLSKERCRLRVSGADAADFLHGQCTNDIKNLAVGQSCYAAFLTAKGKMRGESHILRAENEFFLETNVGLQPSLEKFVVTEDVTIEDVSEKFAQFTLRGPKSEDTLKRIGVVAPVSGAFAAVDGGYYIIFPAEKRDELWKKCIELGARPVSLDELETLRIESGVPKWGADMDENTIPVEAGLEKRAISYEKGCYIGQETIARIKTYGHVNRHLVQLALEKSVPARGEKIFADDKEIGQVTSAAQSARLGKPIALGYVRREFANAGTKLKIGNQNAEVLKLCGA
jgi:folate-binding protein YgfZ